MTCSQILIVVENGELPSKLTELRKIHLFKSKVDNGPVFYKTACFYNFFTRGEASPQYEERKKMWEKYKKHAKY